jgi:hypothetical protein
VDKFGLVRLLKRLRPISKSDERLIEQLRELFNRKDLPEIGNSIEGYVNKEAGQRWDGLVPVLESIDKKQQQLNSCLEELRRSGPRRKRELSKQLSALKRENYVLWRSVNPIGPGRHKTRLREFAEDHPELDSPARIRDAFHKRLKGNKPLSRTESNRLIALCKATLQNIRRSSAMKKRAI